MHKEKRKVKGQNKTILGSKAYLNLLVGHAACRILVPCLGIEPMTPALEAWSLNLWTARKVLQINSL